MLIEAGTPNWSRQMNSNTLPSDAIATALLARLDTIKEFIVARIVKDYNALAAHYAVEGGWGFTRTNRYCGAYSELSKFAMSQKSNDRTNGLYSIVYSNEISMEKASAAAQIEAEAICLAWHRKLVGKLGAVETCVLHHVGGAQYSMTVTKAGVAENIQILQQIVWKTSTRGTWFAQFPARIYVGTKFTPEAVFKARFCA